MAPQRQTEREFDAERERRALNAKLHQRHIDRELARLRACQRAAQRLERAFPVVCPCGDCQAAKARRAARLATPQAPWFER